MTFQHALFDLYEKHYKKLALIPVIIFIACILVLGIKFAKTGYIIDRDISLKGGVEITITKEGLNFNEIESFLKEKYKDVSVRELTNPLTRKSIGVNIKISDETEDSIRSFLKTRMDFNENDGNIYSAKTTQPEFGSSFYKSLLLVVFIGFILMAITVFAAFRTFIPSLAVISAAVIDIVFSLTVSSITGIKLDGGAIVAFLLVIGYSVDTDILLTTRMIKRKEGKYIERMYSAMKTGLTMTTAAIAVMGIGYFVAISAVLENMFFIIVIALIMDIFSTYLTNAGILIWYCKRKGIM